MKGTTMKGTEPLTTAELAEMPQWFMRQQTARDYRTMIHRLLATIEARAGEIVDLNRRAISAESRLDWERSSHEAFVAVHHATVDKIAAERDRAIDALPLEEAEIDRLRRHDPDDGVCDGGRITVGRIVATIDAAKGEPS